MNQDKIYQMDFSRIYQLLINKACKKGRTREETDRIICWLTGYSQAQLDEMSVQTVTYGDFFRNAPQMNENRYLVTGVVCGVRVEAIEDPLLRDIRILDKMIDELAKGKSMDKILRR